MSMARAAVSPVPDNARLTLLADLDVGNAQHESPTMVKTDHSWERQRRHTGSHARGGTQRISERQTSKLSESARDADSAFNGSSAVD